MKANLKKINWAAGEDHSISLPTLFIKETGKTENTMVLVNLKTKEVATKVILRITKDRVKVKWSTQTIQLTKEIGITIWDMDTAA